MSAFVGAGGCGEDCRSCTLHEVKHRSGKDEEVSKDLSCGEQEGRKEGKGKAKLTTSNLNGSEDALP